MKLTDQSNGKWASTIFRQPPGRRRIGGMVLAVLLLGVGLCETASAHGHSSVGVYVGPGWGWYYPPPAYYPPYPPVVVTTPTAPPVYVEKEPEAPSATPTTPGYWYYCHQPDGYYPYVKECPGGWQRVTPQPPPPVQR